MDVQIIGLKSIILGDPGVGKSSIRKLLGKPQYQDYSQHFYYDISVFSQNIEFDDVLDQRPPIYLLELSDSSYNHKERISFYGQGTFCCILVYDVNNDQTINNLNSWFQILKSHNKGKPMPIIILRNKIDRIDFDTNNLEEREKELLSEVEEWTKMKPLVINFSTIDLTGLEDLHNWITLIMENIDMISILDKAFDLYAKLKKEKSNPPSLKDVFFYLKRFLGEDFDLDEN